MPTCHHIWIPLDERVEECTRCGARRQRLRRPPPLSDEEREKRRPLPPAILAAALDIAAPPLGRVLNVTPIDTTNIHGEPIQWPPITENESHD